MARTIGPVTATSASWKVMARAAAARSRRDIAWPEPWVSRKCYIEAEQSQYGGYPIESEH